ncbi:hypothetical protein AM500_04190 [Bacillus sp. FJAT-18017]|nr:hypothetical protein AM500_04190 [Bacillus sp. FJAT-18017]
MQVNERLLNVLIPPAVPVNAGTDSEWKHVETRLGTRLPDDYKSFIEMYGTGSIDNFLWVLNPFEKNENLSLFETGKALIEAYLVSQSNFPEDYPYTVFPSEGGLLPWGLTDNGDELYWLTTGDPNDWPVVVYETRSADNYKYSLSVTEFLGKCLTREMACEAFPEEFSDEDLKFQPLGTRTY